ncbi:methyltransferase [Streptomyces sp. H27-D2]|uniref:methyltransferase n=1 Tax=Streptomyces sp. H27-D2 TaxID=3046304 RepID=UPI002DBE91A5|nr:methyltransferase [Streptomyces sp. H27-D2]MEC4015520.1 methyltransferase [Streptomyces sp. H27-D2]
MDTSPAQPESGSETAAAVHLVELGFGHLYTAALRTAVGYRVADHLAEGPRTAEDLARRTGTDAGALRRVLRYLASREVFRQDEDGAFHLTPAAELLRTDVPGSLHPAISMLTHETFLRSSAGLEETVRSGEPAFPKVFGAPFFEYLRTDAATRELFDAGMASLSGPMDELVAEAYPFPERGVLADVGGGRGGLLRAVLLRHPAMSGVLYDQEPALREHLLDTPELAGRWRTEAGDFFTAAPEGADFYVLKHVLHDWSDADCVRILRSCRRALAPGGRVLVVDAALPAGNEPHPGKALDVAMMAVLEGKERDAAELDALFAEADLVRTRVLPTATFTSIVEAEAAA